MEEVGAYTPAFINAVNFILSPDIEGSGELSLDPTDPGNWTGGAQGKGTLLGTRWGISAAEYPQLDIKGTTREQAVAIYWRDFWNVIRGDQLPQRVSLVVMDSAVNQGPGTAIRILQSACSVPQDGVSGPATAAAARARDPRYLIAAFLAERAFRYALDKGFKADGRDWLRRCFEACQAAT